MATFGGALKNIAMGCASKSGKYDQHMNTKPKILDLNCIGCKICIKECPTNSISIFNNKAFINPNTCTSCGYCLVCKNNAVTYEYSKMNEFIEKMIEYAYGVVKQKNNKIGYINFLINITPDCDCVSWSDKQIVSDIGILYSLDPVSLDQASFDLVKNSYLQLLDKKIVDDIYNKQYKEIDPEYQLKYAEHLGIGRRKYNLIIV